MKKFLISLILFGSFFGMSSVAFAGDPNFEIQLEPVLYEPIPMPLEDPYIDDPTLKVALHAEHLEDGRAVLNWERYNGQDFLHYKVVHSQEHKEPYYPKDGYMDYFDDQNKTRFATPDPLPAGDNYLRLCVISTDDRRGCSNTLHFFQEEIAFEPEFNPENEKPTREELMEEEVMAQKAESQALNKAEEGKTTLIKRLTKFASDNAGLILTFLALIVAVSGFTFASKRKQRSISKYINQIDDTYSEYKMKAKRCEAELYRLRDIVDDELKNGKLDDSAYSLLMQRIENYMIEIQKQIVNEKFGGLPASMKNEMFKMMEDGEIAEKEFEAMQTLIKRSELSSSDQDSLLKTIKEFKHQDEMLKKKKD